MIGVGDDCAVLRPDAGLDLAVTTDMLIERRHFLPDAAPRELGHKALAVNLSDLAAMGATPRWATLAIALPAADAAWLEAFSAGLYALAERYNLDLVGGDTTRADVRIISITAFGEIPPGMALERAGARAGDDIWVSGELGGAALGLVHPEIPAAAKRLHAPEPRVELGERLRKLASAAIDVSDGLAGDLGHILDASKVAATVEYDRLPKARAFNGLNDKALEKRCVLSGGDDYELVFTAPATHRREIETLSAELKLALTRIGAIEAGAVRLTVMDSQGKPVAHGGGYDHFENRK